MVIGDGSFLSLAIDEDIKYSRKDRKTVSPQEIAK
jgi:hypothetical protein